MAVYSMHTCVKQNVAVKLSFPSDPFNLVQRCSSVVAGDGYDECAWTASKQVFLSSSSQAANSLTIVGSMRFVPVAPNPLKHNIECSMYGKVSARNDRLSFSVCFMHSSSTCPIFRTRYLDAATGTYRAIIDQASLNSITRRQYRE